MFIAELQMSPTSVKEVEAMANFNGEDWHDRNRRRARLFIMQVERHMDATKVLIEIRVLCVESESC